MTNYYLLFYTESSIVCLVIFALILFHDLTRIDRQEKQIMYDHAQVAFMLYFISDAFWAAVIAGVLLFRDSINYPANIFITAGVIFFLAILAYNLTLRKRVTYRNIVFNKRRFAVFTAICVLAGAFTAMRRETYYTQPFINSLPVSNAGATSLPKPKYLWRSMSKTRGFSFATSTLPSVSMLSSAEVLTISPNRWQCSSS